MFLVKFSYFVVLSKFQSKLRSTQSLLFLQWPWNLKKIYITMTHLVLETKRKQTEQASSLSYSAQWACSPETNSSFGSVCSSSFQLCAEKNTAAHTRHTWSMGQWSSSLSWIPTCCNLNMHHNLDIFNQTYLNHFNHLNLQFQENSCSLFSFYHFTLDYVKFTVFCFDHRVMKMIILWIKPCKFYTYLWYLSKANTKFIIISMSR